MSRTAAAILSTENLLHNLSIIKSKAKNSKIIAMVKANAYGHGIRSVGLRLNDYVDMLGVASIDEAIALRNAGVNVDILLAQGIFEPDEVNLVSEYGFNLVIHNENHISWLLSSNITKPIDLWIKVNTGMGRLGFSKDKAKVYYKSLSSTSLVKSIKIISHFACADEKDHPLNKKQIEAFEDIIRDTNTKYSFCNSAAILNFPDHHYDYVRPGLALYGVSPIDGLSSQEIGLKPVMTVKSNIVSVQRYTKGDSIGYGARYICDEDMPVGIVSFGYGDGYPIGVKNGAPILVNNIECKLIGRPSMDMIAVDLRNSQNTKIGDDVVLFGEGLPLERLVSFTPNITYDIITGIQNRVKFHWT